MSYGENILEQYMRIICREDFVKNVRPAWLCGLELDFYFPGSNVGVEFQGDHHYIPTAYSPDARPVIKRDQRKKFLCRDHGVTLIRIEAVDLFWRRMRRKLKPILRWNKRDLTINWLGQLRAIDADAVKYRRILRDNFNSPTARRKKSKARQEILAAVYEP